jgi:2-C-methyl-D-erythritol 4-phosphate cytidylyltransferase
MSVPAEAGRPFTAIVLAAQRAGQLDPLAAEAGVSHKCLVPIVGRPLIEYVLDALADTPGVRAIRICVEPDMAEQVKAVPGRVGRARHPIDYVAGGGDDYRERLPVGGRGRGADPGHDRRQC